MRNISQMAISSLTEEYSVKDITVARNRIMNHLNKRFNLKLTNLTSNFFDGDVLRVVLKHMLPKTDSIEHQLAFNSNGKIWREMNNLEKLDYCFELANTHLDVPILFSAADLKQKTMSNDNSKPLLVYLSMLLTANCKPSIDSSIEQQLEACELNSSILRDEIQKEDDELSSLGVRFAEYLKQIDVADKFEVDKIQVSLDTINKFDELIKSEANVLSKLDADKLNSHKRLKDEAKQVEDLISWINQADKLFETSQKSSADLTEAIESYRTFFLPENLPKVEVALCTTLERQYRECLATARQRVLTMQQTVKNWISYEQARKELKEWLQKAEMTLVTALRPNQITIINIDPLEQHLSNLNLLIQYFELEFSELEDDCLFSKYDRLSLSSLSADQSNMSLSGSLISLGSSSSRFSTLSISRKATYVKLFDDFEFKCRLLAANLEADQRDALLLGVRDLKAKLKYITEYKVPQAVNELRLNINRCEMSIKEQDEGDCDEPETETRLIDDESQDLVSDVELVEDNVKENITADHISKINHEEILKKNKKRRRTFPKKSKKTDSSKQAATVDKTIGNDNSKKPEVSYLRMFWNKIVRASKISLSFNIIFLICLAGICVVPLLNKDACCELSQAPILLDNYATNQKPT